MEFNRRYNRSEFISFLQNQFLPEDFVTETTPIVIEREPKYIRTITKLGVCGSLDLVVYEVCHSSTHDARVGLSKEAFRFLADEWESKALVLFVSEGNDANYRFSLITIELSETEEGRLHKIYSNPRRYSYFLGEGIACYTPNKYLNASGRVTDAKDLTDRFSVEVLTKAFYQELSDWYAWAVKVVRFPNKLDDATDDDKYNHEAAIRLVTRLIFVWFLKQKHLIPDEFFDEDYIRENLIEDFNPNAKVDLFFKSDESKYYKAILQNLFFAMLNSPITKEGETELSERHFRSGRGDYDNNKLMRYESMFKNAELFIELANRTVPFLNGGLFDCLDDKDNDNYVDGFSDREAVKKSLIVPDYLFFGEEVGKNIDLSEWYGDKKKKRVSARGIIDILKRYNFTVEENTPFDQDVSLDPELLGKVFENLLASYNPETQTTARKQTGSFYTPRDIVQYMVDESLVAHLKRMVGEELEPEYRKLISYVDEDILLTDEQKLQVMEAIYHCKVLDPACGSGAFPVGMLQQMVHILSQLDPTNEQWKRMMLEEAVNESRNAFQAESREEREERLKDIEASFDENLNNPDYARKLYLIENCIYGVDIQPIAIQISKLRFFISLVVDQKTNNNPVMNFGIRPLPNLEAKFVAANSLIPLAKSDGELGRTPEIKAIENKLKEANHKIFSAKTVRTKRRWKDRLIELRSEMAEKLADNGFLTADAANQMSSWDMFDQNSAASFFDADWMFGIKDGFDIVIGNPPYVNAIELKKKLGVIEYIRLKSFYDTSKGTVDFYVYFFEKGIKLLRADGILSFITPNKYLCANYGKELRNFFIINTRFLQFLDVSRDNIFDASIYPIVVLLQKNNRGEDYYFESIDKERIKRMFHSSQLENFPDKIWGFLLSSKYGIVNRIINECENITNYCKINATSTASEADIFHSYIEENVSNGLKLINTGTIDPFVTNWGKSFLLDKGCKYLQPTLPNSIKVLGANRKRMYNMPKIIVAKMSLKVEAFWDKYGNYASVNTNCLHSITIAPQLLMGWIHSKLFHFIYECYFEGLKMSGGYLPFSAPYLSTMCIPQKILSCEDIIKLVNEIINNKQSVEENMMKIDNLIYKLCNLTYDEVLRVDPETPITREEYESNN